MTIVRGRNEFVEDDAGAFRMTNVKARRYSLGVDVGRRGLGAQVGDHANGGLVISIAADFNPFDEFNILRLICGLFLLPHCYAKFYVPAALQFWVAAGFKPPKPWMYLAGAIEAVLAIALISGIFVTLAGAIATFHLAVAAVAVYRLTGKYLWNIGGCEFCLFWAICCWILAMHSFHAGGIWH